MLYVLIDVHAINSFEDNKLISVLSGFYIKSQIYDSKQILAQLDMIFFFFKFFIESINVLVHSLDLLMT